MSVIRGILICIVCIHHFSVLGIVIRHDIDDKKYLASSSDFPPLATLYNIGAHGTLIAPQWVITAGHTVFCTGPGDKIKIGERLFEVESRYTHGDYQAHWWSDSYDIALLKLVTPVEGVTPAKLYTGRDELDQDVWFIGEGGTGNGETGQTRSYKDGKVALRKAQNRISSVSKREIEFIFDKGERGLPLEGVSGNGDSGGPAYKKVDNDYYLLGVSSRADSEDIGTYGIKEIYSRVSSYVDWIDRVIAEDSDYIAKHTSQYHFASDELIEILPKVCAKIGF